MIIITFGTFNQPKVTNKTIVYSIAILSIIASVAGFIADIRMHDDPVYASVFKILIFAFLLFIVLSINIFALMFCFKLLRRLLKTRRDN
ncbi:MAG TPA: hypothetical protein VF581_11435 [Flavobacterium sp.]|jgi:O-antigen/teichoic acid export membrane protein